MDQTSFQQKNYPAAPMQLSPGFTLQQAIGILDRWLGNLESLSTTSVDESKDQYIEELETRFEIFAEEIANLKQIVFSLQSYTMDVNKVLMEDKLKFSARTRIDTDL